MVLWLCSSYGAVVVIQVWCCGCDPVMVLWLCSSYGAVVVFQLWCCGCDPVMVLWLGSSYGTVVVIQLWWCGCAPVMVLWLWSSSPVRTLLNRQYVFWILFVQHDLQPSLFLPLSKRWSKETWGFLLLIHFFVITRFRQPVISSSAFRILNCLFRNVEGGEGE
jgi:hypothetical protein